MYHCKLLYSCQLMTKGLGYSRSFGIAPISLVQEVFSAHTPKPTHTTTTGREGQPSSEQKRSRET